ncbi:conserved hypothetical protein [Streptomyces misionensis JCM 4497]
MARGPRPLTAGHPRTDHRHRPVLGHRARAVPDQRDPGNTRRRRHRLRYPRPALLLRLHLTRRTPAGTGTRQRRPRRRRRLVAHRHSRAPAPDRSGTRRIVPAHLGADDPRIRAGDVPRGLGLPGHRHHRRRAVDSGRDRIGRRTLHHPDRRHRRRRRSCEPVHQGKEGCASCLSSPSRASASPSRAPPCSRTSSSPSPTGSSSLSSARAAAASPRPLPASRAWKTPTPAPSASATTSSSTGAVTPLCHRRAATSGSSFSPTPCGPT